MLLLSRKIQTEKFGMFGVMHDMLTGMQFCSLERPWLDNQPMVSCIPAGTYHLVEHDSPRFGRCYAVMGLGVGLTPGKDARTFILIHAANIVDELSGCIAVGAFHTVMQGKWAIANSRKALGLLEGSLAKVKDDERQLIIKDDWR